MAKKSSWLQKKEQRKSLREGILYFLATIVALFLLLRFGIPALIKLAGFLGDLRSSTQLVEKEDAIPPIPPRFEYTDETTREQTINLSGSSEAGTIVKVSLNGSLLKEVIADKEGRFNLENVRLQSGKNTLMAVAWDQAGNESAPSQKLVIYFDKEPPSLEISQPEDGTRFFDEERQITIKGITEEEVVVMVNERRAIVDLQGQFSLNFSLSEGNNEIKVVATDPAGNETEQTINVEYIP